MKKQCGGVWGREGGQNHLLISMDIPFPVSVPLSLTNCLPLRQIPLAEYIMGVQPGRLGSIEPPPNLNFFFFCKKCHFHKYLAKLGVSPFGTPPPPKYSQHATVCP